MKRVLKRWPTKAITVYVDIKDVDRAAKKVSRDSDDDSNNKKEFDDISSLFPSNGFKGLCYY